MTDTPRPTPIAGWYEDPTGIGDARYWDGTRWSETISRDGVTIAAPIDAGRAGVPPLPGTEFLGSTATRAPQPLPTVSPAPARRSSSPGLTVAIIAVAIALVLAIVLVISLGSDSDDPTDDTGVPEQTDPPATEAPAEGG